MLDTPLLQLGCGMHHISVAAQLWYTSHWCCSSACGIHHFSESLTISQIRHIALKPSVKGSYDAQYFSDVCMHVTMFVCCCP